MDFDRKEPASADQPTEENDFFVQAPSISLPKGGGAVRGIGEKFAANPVTGTGSLSVPIATSPGRSGFGPQLSLSYDSGAGNGVFGLGWNLSLPNISRKTDKGLPQYIDANESDVFLLSGAEDLVPELEQTIVEPRTVNNGTYEIKRYRPRIEGLFARIEKWTNTADAADVFWRSISKENITTWYGKNAESRVTDPNDPRRTFNWLVCESYDDKGNVISYEYKAEDSTNVDLFQAHERNRTDIDRTANRYLKRIKYGNRYPYFATLAAADPPTPLPSEWFFEVVFDYGEHTAIAPLPEETGAWKTRKDPFSRYRAGFEVRTYRLCERVLMFHHFDGADIQDQPGAGKNYLVKSTNFTYQFNEDESSADIPKYTVLQNVTHTGHRKKATGEYDNRSIPPVEFTYSPAEVGKEVKNVVSDSIENLPAGVDGSRYQWVDLDGEGLTGVLTEQGGGWFYKYNKSPLTRQRSEQETQYNAQLGATQRIRSVPTGGLSGVSGRQFMDLAGNGRPDLVEMARPLAGFYQRSAELDWEPFRSFQGMPNIDWQDPNLKFIDLTGDGHADIVVSEGDVFTWYESLAEKGFGEANRATTAEDEEQGPRIVFADGTDTIVQADLSGDGLTDIARIRNGEICYWPNLGYGRFGKKVTMGGAPWFAPPDQFDPSRLRLTDVDGSGVTDIIYLGGNATTIWFNQSGNSWSAPQTIDGFPTTDSVASVAAVDLLGNGTACLVWSSPAPADSLASLRYIELMAKGKPHLLVTTKNNMGAETEIQYVPSTYFYLQDQRAGKPWTTRLPFPVHVVAKVVVTDKWRKSRFATQYSYHHGYFDGIEREFRGFGRVEQTDIETFGEFAAGNAASPYITNDLTLYQPPVKTISWFHTGAALERDKILDQFKPEYFPNGQNVALASDFQENDLPPVDLSTLDLSTEEWREAIRACKGMPLRQEVYELAVDPLAADDSSHVPVKLFSTTYHNCNIQRLQAKGGNKHAVFLVTESEAITYNYELDLTQESLLPDPRISHTLNLNIDEYGNVLQAVAAVYPRIGRHVDPSLQDDTLNLIESVQKETHLAYTEARVTNDINSERELDNYRLRLPCEVKTYELTGISPADDQDRVSPDPKDNFYFTLEELRTHRLSERYSSTGSAVTPLLYHEQPNGTEAQKRLVEHVRNLYFDNDLNNHLPFGEINSLALPFETYKLALTDELLNRILQEKLTPAIRADLADVDKSGYLSESRLEQRFEGMNTRGEYWVRSGIAGFASNADEHFYLPERFTDAFGNTSEIQFDDRDLFVELSTSPKPDPELIGNTTRVLKFDYRVLSPCESEDMNFNISEVVFDTMGLPIAVALKGKGDEADNLGDYTDELIDLDEERRGSFFTNDFSEAVARNLLGNATARHVYDFGETKVSENVFHFAQRPAGAAGITRERHVAKPTLDATGQPLLSKLQVAFEYSDASGNGLVTKSQAEPAEGDDRLRWIASGKTILNNKGKPVKQYEPYFSEREIAQDAFEPDHRFEEPKEVGVTPIIYYDAAGRVVRTELPDGNVSYATFSPWQVESFDPNDTAYNSDPSKQTDWYRRRIDPNHDLFDEYNSPENQRTANLTQSHANTPARVFLDSLGREVISIAHNRVANTSGSLIDEHHVTFTKLDAEGKPLWIRDARNNLVMQYITPLKPTRASEEDDTNKPELMPAGSVPCYDIAGNLLCQHSMDAGSRWMINDASGQPFYAWDENERTSANSNEVVEERILRTEYDALRRPLENQLQINGGSWQTIERVIYGESRTNAHESNLRGQVYQHYDASGLITNEAFDFKGNLLTATRQLSSEYDAEVINWPRSAVTAPPTNKLEEDFFTQSTEYDALSRMTHQENWHLQGHPPATYIPQYNERGILKSEKLLVNNEETEAIRNINYDEKGQRKLLELGNNTFTRYDYDPETFRLIHLVTQSKNRSKTYQNLHYSYDPVGNITEILDTAQQTIYFRNSAIEPHCAYEYDALYRLIKAQGREHAVQNNVQRDNTTFVPTTEIPFPNSPEALQNYTETYQYDAVGNILGMAHTGKDGAGWTRFYQYALDSNRLLATGNPGDNRSNITHYAATPAPQLAQHYKYDTHGSMLAMDRSIEVLKLHWDYRDMIHQLNLDASGESQAWYNYDSQKQRTRKHLVKNNGTIIEERFYLGGMELYRRSVNGTLVEEIETHHLFATDDRVLIVENVIETDGLSLGAGILFRYQYSNHLGSVGLELDVRARVISYEEYHPYGTTAYQARNKNIKAAKKRYRYTGMERDKESGLCYHTARHYLPWLGRWGSSDPIGVEGGINVYNYCVSNPIALSDSLGKQPETEYTFDDHQVQGEITRFQVLPPNGDRIIFGEEGATVIQADNEDDITLTSPVEIQANPESGVAAVFNDSPALQFAAGVATGGMAGAAPGGFLIAPVGEISGVADEFPAAYQGGYGIGELFWGVAQIIVGGLGVVAGSGLAAGGGGLAATGAGAPVGAPAVIGGVSLASASGLLVAEGVADVLSGGAALMSSFDNPSLPEWTHQIVDTPNPPTYVQTAKQARDQASRTLGSNLERQGLGRLPGEEAHHIVEFNNSAAEGSRDILNLFDIDINSAVNGVWLTRASRNSRIRNPISTINRAASDHGTTGLASSVHSAAYSQAVYERLVVASVGGRSSVIRALAEIRLILLNGGTP